MRFAADIVPSSHGQPAFFLPVTPFSAPRRDSATVHGGNRTIGHPNTAFEHWLEKHMEQKKIGAGSRTSTGQGEKLCRDCDRHAAEYEASLL